MPEVAKQSDWTRGPAKLAAVVVLALLGGGAMLGPWSHARRADVAGAGGAVSTLIDLNAASEAELGLLPGIGPAIAGRIVAYREEHGPFRTVDDLDRVKGIGPKILEKVRPLVRVGESR